MSSCDSSQLMPRSLVVVCIYLFMLHTSEAGRIVEHTTDGTTRMDLMNNYGVPIAGFKNLVFDVKACANAVFVLSEKFNFTNRNSKYFMVMLGASKGKRLNGLKDSCFQCSIFQATALKSTVSCSHFKTYFVRWDNKGSIMIGTGTDATNLQKVFLEYKSPKSFSLNFLNVMSLKNKATWRFRVESKPPITGRGNVATFSGASKESKTSKVVEDAKTPKDAEKTMRACEREIEELKKKADEEAQDAIEEIDALKKETDEIKEEARTDMEKFVKKFKEEVTVKTDELLSKLDNLKI